MDELLTAGQPYTAKSGVLDKKRFPANGSVRGPVPIDRGVFGMLIFLSSEVMFFAGMISAFLVLRAGSAAWPPPNQPLLPSLITGINTMLLLISAYTMDSAVRAIRRGNQKMLLTWLGVTGCLGMIFLAIQGVEWIRLVQFGLTFSSSIYGGIFYVLIGCHGVHVLAAVIVLLVMYLRAARKDFTAEQHSSLALSRMYWFFVVGLWPLLYVLVYLS